MNFIQHLLSIHCIAHEAEQLSLVEIDALQYQLSVNPKFAHRLRLTERRKGGFLGDCIFEGAKEWSSAFQEAGAFEAPVANEGWTDHFVDISHLLN